MVSSAMNEVMGGKFVATVNKMDSTMARTMLAAQSITDQVAQTTKDAAQHLNDTVR
jgi:hypothetical protein